MRCVACNFWQVMEELQREREDYLLCQADNLAIQMAKIIFQKAERWTKVLETSKAMVTLQSQLIQQLRDRKISELQDLVQSIHSHSLVGCCLENNLLYYCILFKPMGMFKLHLSRKRA